jgi:hypothetical protein
VSCLIPLAATNNEIRCSVCKTVSKKRTVRPALSSTTQVMNAPVVHAQSHTDVRNDCSHGYPTAVVSFHQRFNGETHCLHLNSSKTTCDTLYKHDDVLTHRRWVDPREDAHHEDVHVGSADASTWGRSSGGGEFHIRNEHHWMFVHEQQGVFDVLTLRPCHKDGVCEKDRAKHCWAFVCISCCSVNVNISKC